MSFALASSWEELDHDDSSLLEGNNITWALWCLFFGTLLLGLDLGVFAPILRLEYLRSHIGEKRPADLASKTIQALLRAYLLMTALINSAVIFILRFFPLAVMRPIPVSHFILTDF